MWWPKKLWTTRKTKSFAASTVTAYWLRTDCSSSARCKEPGAASSSPGQGKATRRHGVGLGAANHRQCRAQCSRWMATAQCGMNQQRRLYGSQLVLLGQGADSLCGCGEFGRKDRSSATGPWDARPDALATGKEHDRGRVPVTGSSLATCPSRDLSLYLSTFVFSLYVLSILRCRPFNCNA